MSSWEGTPEGLRAYRAMRKYVELKTRTIFEKRPELSGEATKEIYVEVTEMVTEILERVMRKGEKWE